MGQPSDREDAPGVLKKRSSASSVMVKQSANKNTPLTRAARISALCQPYVYWVVGVEFAVSYLKVSLLERCKSRELANLDGIECDD